MATVNVVFTEVSGGSAVGYWPNGYSPDSGTVWEDLVGPLSVAGAPVGLVWDQSKGTSLGTNIIGNSTFDADLSWWEVQGTQFKWDNGRMWLDNSNTSNDLVRYSGLLPQGFHLWELDMDVAQGALRTAHALSFPATIDKDTSDHHQWVVYNPSTTLRTTSMYRAPGGAATLWLDNLTCRKLPGNPAYQGTTLSRPTLVRWPRGGRQNVFKYTKDLSNAVWSKTNLTLTGGKPDPFGGSGAVSLVPVTATDPGSSARTCRVFQTTGDANNRMRFSIYFKPINAISRYPNPPDTTEEDRDVRLHIVTESSHLGGAVSVNMRTLEFEGTAFLEAVAYGLDDVGSGWYRVWFTADKSPSGVGNNFIYLSNRVGITFDPYPDGTEEVWIYGPMLEFGDDVDLSQPPGPYQKVTTAYDVTEEGVPSVYHILDDGSDTIDVVLPAGNYDVAYVESDGAVSYDTVTSDGSTPLSTLFAERQVDVIVKSGTFSQGEKDAIEYFWARYS